MSDSVVIETLARNYIGQLERIVDRILRSRD
jgi:hypothetical protein